MKISNFLENSDEKKKAIGLIHRVYITQLKNSRVYNASTKTKSEVRGGGRKPWKQKGTGRARAGSLRSPLFVGGGISFGPKHRIVFKKINKKEKRLAILSALFLKQKQFILFNEENSLNQFEKIQTKTFVNLLKLNNLTNESKVLIILSKPSLNFYKNFWLASRNLKNIEITTTVSLNLKQILNANHIIVSQNALDLITSKN